MSEENSIDRTGECVAAVDKLVRQLRIGCQQKYGNWAVEPSVAMSELAEAAHQDFAEDVISMASLRFIVAVDHGFAVAELLRQEGETVFATFPLVRAQMECAAALIWLTESVNPEVRLNRYLSLRVDGLQQRLITVKASENAPKWQDRMQADFDRLLAKVRERNYKVISDKNGRIRGVGAQMPGVTKLIDQTLGWGVPYRLFSAITHGERTAIVDAGILMNEEKRLGEVKRKPQRAEMVCGGVVASLATAGVSLARFFGWDAEGLWEHVFAPAYAVVRPEQPQESG